MSLENRRVKDFKLPSRTKQSFKEDADINNIVKRYKKVTGDENLQSLNSTIRGDYGDFSSVVDYRSALDQVRRAGEVFDALPAIVRKRFDNDPATFLDFCHNPANEAELVSMGLANPKNPPQQNAVG